MMPQRYPCTYECHVTLRPKDIEEARRVAHEHKFKTSVIVGDEQDEKVKYVYCTTHDVSFPEIFSRMNRMVAALQVPIIRKKIEHILYDEDYRKLPRYEVGETVEVKVVEPVDVTEWVRAKVERLNNGSVTEPENLVVRILPGQGFHGHAFTVQVGDYRKL